MLWPNYRLRIRELLELAKYFDYAGYPGTAEWVRLFADRLAESKSVPQLEGEFGELVKTFEGEFEKGDL